MTNTGLNYSIANNYSVLNNYNYEDKSSFLNCLDKLSGYARRILGGRDVCVLSQTANNPLTTPEKVKAVFKAVIIFPLGIITAGSLLVKVLSFPCFWEKKKIITQSQQAQTMIIQFQTDVNTGNYQAAVTTLLVHPHSKIIRKNPIIDIGIDTIISKAPFIAGQIIKKPPFFSDILV